MGAFRQPNEPRTIGSIEATDAIGEDSSCVDDHTSANFVLLPTQLVANSCSRDLPSFIQQPRDWRVIQRDARMTHAIFYHLHGPAAVVHHRVVVEATARQPFGRQ